ncbi:DUF3307 domain-containing protein [Halioxenophilus aromaticivorans]|uniref:DUF3307 domain-containing protein n=1 Tax=Halioxenophilus aromaticivorans TaxID=1306992 RepID=A0AAV3U4N4_9ALTE
MELLLLLLAAHFVADFYLQAGKWIHCRNENHFKSPGLWKHGLVHLVLYLAVLLLWFLPGQQPAPWLQVAGAVAILAISHVLTDGWKSYRPATLLYFLIDQIIHITIIFALWLWITDTAFDDIKRVAAWLMSSQNLAIALAYLLVGKPASVLISMALKRHTDAMSQTAEQGEAGALTGVGLASAGAWIGYIERFLTLSFVLMGQFTGIGFLVATKTIFRFGDLTTNKDMKLTEYMMLGTLLSFAFALAVGWLTIRSMKA